MGAIDVQNSILKAVDTIAMRRIEQLKLDKTIIAVINSAVGVVNKRKIYKVEYEGGYFNATAQNENDAYLPRMAVYVQIPEGDFSREKFILGKASSLATDTQVSAVSALASNYSINGKNIVKNNSDTMGVYSYHDPKEEETDASLVNHRFNFLYDKNDNNYRSLEILDTALELYKKNSTALMIRAEFMTKLTNEQKKKATGEYGLVFNLVFNNLAAGLGETQEEVFNYFKEKIKILDNNSNEIDLNIINEKLFKYLEDDTKTYDDLIMTDGYLDQIISQVQEVDRVFKNNNSSQYTKTVEDLISKYIALIQDIKRAKSIQDMKEIYHMWMDEVIGQPAEKKVSYYLSSNDMIGNPFSFSSWMSQYAVFDIDLENFIGIDSILLYKQGFIEDSNKEILWQYDERKDETNPDILVRDIQMYMMRPLSDSSSGYQLKVEDKTNGMTFTGENKEAELTVQATLLREYFEDLTKNSDTKIYWFKQSESIVSPAQNEYSIYGGIGWKELIGENSSKLTINIKDTLAYENHYRCTVVYMGEETPVILRYDFIIYNYKGQAFIIQSNLGDNFSFDAGSPVLTLYKKEGENLSELYSELPNETAEKHYKFKWAIIDSNNQKTFLDEKNEINLKEITTSNYLNYTNTSKLLKDIKWYCGATDITENLDRSFATKIQYPMSNIASATKVTFECYINYRETNNEDFYPLGKTTITLSNFEMLSANSYRIFIENGDQVFQYDEYGNAPNVAKFKNPIDVLPLKVHLFAPNNIEIQNNGNSIEVQNSSFRVKWFFPIEESLIIYEDAKEDPATGYYNLYTSNEVGFKIKELYDYNAIDNQIKCQVDFNDQTLYAETSLTFTKVGNNGTNGTDVIAKIVPKKWNDIYYSQPFTLYVDKLNDKVFCNGDVPRSSSYQNTKNFIDLNEYLTTELYQKSQKINEQDISTRWNIAGNTSSANNKHGKYIKINNDYTLSWENELYNGKYNQYILKSENVYDKKSYYAFYNMPVIFYEKRVPVEESARIGINLNTYLKEIIYNADGRNPLYNYNQGLELINVPQGCSFSWTACGGYVENESNPNFKLLPEKDSKKNEATLSIIDTEKSHVYILPDDSFTGEVTNNYIKCIVKKDNQDYATIIAPIYMSLNTFGLASLNAWDGNSITIDEDEGYIMAPQIGAGYKNNSTNLFTGVVMGQADDYSSGGKHLYTGLLGYKDGVRSFFLDAENGNAFFGYPTLNGFAADDRVKKYKDGQWTDIDNYGEGEIQLIPGEISKIGGWRLGRKSLYYTAKKTKNNKEKYEYSGEIGEKYSDSYAVHHIKDIDAYDQGILLSAIPPYISIKSREIIEEQSDENSQIKKGDSVEIQLDPENIASLAIFRHYMDGNKEKREQLSGLNNKGQLVANQMIQIPAKDKEEEQSTKTSLGIEKFTVFNTSHTGLNLGLGKVNNFDDDTNPFFRVSLQSDQISTGDQVYITAGRTNVNDYVRPISIHGKSIKLYALGSNSINPITNTKFILSDSLLQGQSLNGAGFTFYNSPTTENPESSIISKTNLKISSSDYLYTLRTGIQNIEANGNITVKYKKNDDNKSSGVFKLQGGEAFTLTGEKGTITTEENSSTKNIIKINNSELSIYRTSDNYIKMHPTGLEINALQTGDTILKLHSQDKILLQSESYKRKNAFINPALSFEVLNNNDVSAWFRIADAKPSNFGENNATTPFYFGTNRNYGNRYIQVSQWYINTDTGGRFYDGTIKTNLSLNVMDNHNIQTSGGNVTVAINKDKVGNFIAEAGPDHYTFNQTSITGSNNNSLIASGNNLQDLIQGCLNAAAYAKKVADDAQAAADAAQDAADAAQAAADAADAHAGKAESAANAAQATANNKVDKNQKLYLANTNDLVDDFSSDSITYVTDWNSGAKDTSVVARINGTVRANQLYIQV